MENPTQSLKYLEELEALGGEILADRQEIVALDKQRNMCREGLRALINSKCDKTWITVGPMLVKMNIEQAKDRIKKDQLEFDKDVNKLRSNLKEKVNELQDKEMKQPIPGLMLKPLDKLEMGAMNQVLGRYT